MSDAISATKSRNPLFRVVRGAYRFARSLVDLPRQVESVQKSSLVLSQQLEECLRLSSLVSQHSASVSATASNIDRVLSDLTEKFGDVREFAIRLDSMARSLHAASTEVEALGREARRNARRMPFLLNAKAPTLSEPDRSASFPDILKRLERDYPKVYPIWKTLFDNAVPLYQDDPDANLSTVNHPTATRFRDWVNLYAYGRLLDIGCGPVAVPHYLDGYDLSLVAGLDPLDGREPHPFQFYRGCAEYLPWPDGSFETVVIATSLDHVISLRKTLSEIRRVLSPSGVLILWLGFIPGGKYFDPHPEEEPVPIDNYHLFHFDRPWFEEIMAEYFTLEAVQQIDIEQSFYVYSRSEA
ncbi:class I SAM-dependent methyltransferase [Microvirga terricola]|uniref:Methyltransferase domain-containing protein n=1 Tax=Microvirga terricola TaxID=2719797 RepID=A0ABX0VCY1_9HYPH|nr:methyltransferase domain-containing protein [Microvirga terricola]NIX76820.1 methyltransferase domain-containing protein [Microvirga terricola]